MGEPDFFDLSQDMLCIATADGRFRRVNDTWTRTLGWSAEELCSVPFVEFVHPEDRARTSDESEQLAQGHPTIRFRNRYRSKCGDYHWVDWRAVVHETSGEVYASARDVTREVQLHEQLVAREELLTTMVARQLRAREEEHRRIAVELHDSALQHAVAALMFLDSVPVGDPAVDEPVDLVRGEVGLALETTRRVMQGLDPLDLGEQGLAAVLDCIGSEMANRFRIPVEVNVEAGEVEDDVANALCRMVRESLVNAAKHARPTRLEVSVGSNDLHVWAEVRDDGCGIDASRDGVPAHSGMGLGLAFLHERAASLGGELRITSGARGTLVRMVVPNHSAAAPEAAGTATG